MKKIFLFRLLKKDKTIQNSKTEDSSEIKLLEQFKPFLKKHAAKRDSGKRILSYFKHKVSPHLIVYGCEWIITDDCIKYSYQWAGHSFFDDGGGEEGYEAWTLSFVGDKEVKIENERLDDLKQYDVSFDNSPIHERFYCRAPFGLKGIYEIRFDGSKIETD